MNATYSNLWWVLDGELAGMGIPFVAVQRRLDRGGDLRAHDDDLPLLHESGIRAVVSLLNIESDQPIFQAAGFDFQSWPIKDGDAPSVEQAVEFVRFVDECRVAKKPVAVFCEAGLGRTGTMLASYLISRGENPNAVIATIRKCQPAAIETRRQVEFLAGFPEALAGVRK